MTAHPRSRGENAIPLKESVSGPGSSPLTRGKRRLRQVPAGRARLIPAHAGKTSTRRIGWIAGAAHPRSRGENSQAKTIPARGPGSSPLTRGKPWQYAVECRQERLIPAHAGKTITWVAQLITSWAHPRSRGENRDADLCASPHAGSSPLTRGKPHGNRPDAGRARLIPAHAGKTRCAHAH